MLHSTPSITRLCKRAVLTLGCAVSLFGLSFSLHAADAPASGAHDPMDKSKPLPMTATFEKVAGSEDAPYALKLKNDSKESLTVSAKILLAVAYHAENKARMIPEHTVKAGESWSIPGLAADDKVTVTAKGYAPLQLTVK